MKEVTSGSRMTRFPGKAWKTSKDTSAVNGQKPSRFNALGAFLLLKWGVNYSLYMTNEIETVDRDLERKKDLIIDAVRVGMGLGKAFVYAQCTERQVEILQIDKEFQRRVTYVYAQYEKDLLDLHSMSMLLAARRGNAGPAQWKLGKLNPSRWGEAKTEDGPTMPTIIFEAEDNGLI